MLSHLSAFNPETAIYIFRTDAIGAGRAMTVAELIEALKLKDPAARVVLEGPYSRFADADIPAVALRRNPAQHQT